MSIPLSKATKPLRFYTDSIKAKEVASQKLGRDWTELNLKERQAKLENLLQKLKRIETAVFIKQDLSINEIENNYERIQKFKIELMEMNQIAHQHNRSLLVRFLSLFTKKFNVHVLDENIQQINEKIKDVKVLKNTIFLLEELNVRVEKHKVDPDFSPSEALFRMPGSVERVKKLTYALMNDEPIDLSQYYDADLASVIKELMVNQFSPNTPVFFSKMRAQESFLSTTDAKDQIEKLPKVEKYFIKILIHLMADTYKVYWLRKAKETDAAMSIDTMVKGAPFLETIFPPTTHNLSYLIQNEDKIFN